MAEDIPDFMDLDLVDIPDELLDVNDAFIGQYLNTISAADDNTGGRVLLPSFDLDDPLLEPPASLPVVSGSAATSGGSYQEVLPGAPAILPSDPNAYIPAPQLPTMSSGAGSGLDLQSYPVGEGEEDDEEEEHTTKGRRGAGGRKITPQRKQNNRKAQQRYREKRKQQAVEREQQVAVLSSQLAAMQGIQNEHAAVSTENVHLREILLQKEAEIENLKKMMAEQTSQNMDDVTTRDHSVNIKESPRSDDDVHHPEEDHPGIPHGVDRNTQVQMTHKEATAKLKGLVQEMTAILQAHGLPTDNYAGSEAYSKDSVTCKLRPIVLEANKISVKRLLSAPTCPVERSSYCSKRFSMVHPCSIFRTHWMGILERLHIDSSQTDALLAARTAALEQLRVIYENRTALNQMTMAIMLPNPDPEALHNGTTSHKLKEMERWGSKCALSHSQRLADALDKIRNSLRSEQKIFAGLHDMLVLKVLTPGQAAMMFILDNEGWIVEPLQITNLLALNRGLIEEPSMEDEAELHAKRQEMTRQSSEGAHSSMLPHGVAHSDSRGGLSAGTM